MGWINGVNITFELAKFVVEDDYKVNRIVKLYGEQLDESEVAKIVSDLAKLHTKFIQEKMIEVKNRIQEINETISE